LNSGCLLSSSFLDAPLTPRPALIRQCTRAQAVWALGNIAGDSPQCRNMVLSNGALPPLLEQLTENQKMSMLRNATWTLSNFCRGKPPPDFSVVRARVLCLV
jgi:hypothetical protein